VAYDLKIRDGTIVDGTGRPRFTSDLGVVGRKIVAVGDAPDSAHTEIDASGKISPSGCWREDAVASRAAGEDASGFAGATAPGPTRTIIDSGKPPP